MGSGLISIFAFDAAVRSRPCDLLLVLLRFCIKDSHLIVASFFAVSLRLKWRATERLTNPQRHPASRTVFWICLPNSDREIPAHKRERGDVAESNDSNPRRSAS